MTHRVLILPDALDDLREIAAELDRETNIVGFTWLDRLVEHVFTLEMFPTRCPVAEIESEKWGIEVRCLLFGRRPHVRRILFTIVGSTVRVLHVTHGARDR